MTSLIETQGLGYSYPDGTTALRNVCIEIDEGSKVALIGPNGSGKTTLINLLVGLLRPTSGQVLFEGAPISYDRRGLSALRAQVGVLFQNPDDQLFAPTVWQDVAFGPYNLGVASDEVESRVETALQLMGVERLWNKPPHMLSAGEKKRVAIAGLITTNPKVLLLDEPMSSLDIEGMDKLMDALELLNIEKEIALVYTSHRIDGLAMWADMAYIMSRGLVLSHGEVKAIARDKEFLKGCGLLSDRKWNL